MKNLPIIAALALVVVMLWSWFVPVEYTEALCWKAHTTAQLLETGAQEFVGDR